MSDPKRRRYRTVWISDVHLGTRECRAEFLLDFLRKTECENLYLVGDIFDLWAMRRSVHWPASHNEIVRLLLNKARHGTRVIYLPGNHDELIRDYDGMSFGAITIRDQVIHENADGRRMLVLHGDAFDGVIRCGGLGTLLGDHLYDTLLAMSRWITVLRRRFGFPYWSLAAYLKRKVKNAAAYVDRFDGVVAEEARRLGVNGVVCGHIHRPRLMERAGTVYANDGDWVESCTALVELEDGSMELVHWSDHQHVLARVESQPVVLKDAA